MGMRMGSAHFMANYQLSLNNAYQKQAKLFEQADGSSLHRASDNPMTLQHKRQRKHSVSREYQDCFRLDERFR